MEKNINIIEVRFGGKNNLTVPDRHQHDKGQIIRFSDISDGTQVEFSNENHERAEPYIVKNSQVEIPDFLLEENSPISAFVKVVDNNSETTVRTITIPVISRPESDDGIPLKNQQTFKQQMQEIMDSTSKIAQSVRDDADKGKFKGDKGDKGEPGENYNLTEVDKEEISKSAKDKVIEEIQPTLDEKVPITRKVAELPLNENIQGYDLINAIKDYSPFLNGVQNALKTKYAWEEILADKNNEFSKAVQTVGGTLDSLDTINKSSYVSALNELVSTLSDKADKNEWELFNTYMADGENSGFEYTSASGIKAKEIMIVGWGLTFSAGVNMNLGFRTSENPYTSGHKQLVFANGFGTSFSYQICGLIKRIGIDKILVSLEVWSSDSVSTVNVAKRQVIFKDAELFTGKNIVYVCNTVSGGNKINTGTMEIYVRGRY